jgi:DNA polymerase
VDLGCTRCRLSRGRTQVVPAEGAATAKIFLVGEAPGPDEDLQGRPFIGRAGRILRRCLEAAGVPAEDVWISNAVKCFPHEVVGTKRRIRKPKRDEADACRPWLLEEIRAVAPRVVVAVGSTAAAELTGDRNIKVTKARGARVEPRPELAGVRLFVTFHPSGLHYGHGTEDDLARDLAAAYAAAVEGG